jgi:flagellar protein FliO/FliZ
MVLLPAWAWAQNENYSRFKNVTSESKSDELVLRFEFDRRFVPLPEAVFSRTSIQLDFNTATIVPAKQFFYTSDSVIPQVYVYQPIQGTVRVRLGLAEKIEDLAGRLEMVKRGRFLEVRISKEKPVAKEVSKDSDILQQLLSRASKEVTPSENGINRSVPVQSAALTQEISAEKKTKSIQKVELPRTRKTNDKFKSVGKATDKKDSPFSQAFESSNPQTLDVMPSSLRMVTMLLLVVAFMLLLFYLFKKFVLKNTPFGGSGKMVQVLGTGFLGPRNNIALVEVAGDVLVLGISNDNITLLSHIEDEEKIADIKSRSVQNKPVKGKLDSTIKKAISKSPTAGSPKRKPFVNVLRQFANQKTSKDKSVAEVSAQIRRNLKKIQMQ